jgi:hypothetical protein
MAVFAASLALTVAVWVIIWFFFALRAPDWPLGIVHLELAANTAQAERVIDAWAEANVRGQAEWNTYLDYLFLVGYSTTLSLVCVWASAAFKVDGASTSAGARIARFLGAVGIVLAWNQWLAGLYDAAENIALLQMLRGRTASPWPETATFFATAKFALLATGALYIVVLSIPARIIRCIARLRRPRPPMHNA